VKTVSYILLPKVLGRSLLICIVLSAMASFSVSVFADNEVIYQTELPDALNNSGWNLMLNDAGVEVYTRDWPGSNFVAVKGVQTINSSLSNILANYADVASFPEWVKDMVEARVVDAFDQNRSRKVYMRMGLPWPLRDRDMISGQQFSQNNQSKVVHVKEWYEGDALPPIGGVIRMPRLNSELVLIPLGKNRTKLIYQGHNDPGGFIPAFLVNWMIEEVFFDSMLNMKVRFESIEYQKDFEWVSDL